MGKDSDFLAFVSPVCPGPPFDDCGRVRYGKARETTRALATSLSCHGKDFKSGHKRAIRLPPPAPHGKSGFIASHKSAVRRRRDFGRMAAIFYSAGKTALTLARFLSPSVTQ